MAMILRMLDGKLGRRVKNLMKTAYVKASKFLRDSRSKWSDMKKELQDDLEDKALQKWWDQTIATTINRLKDHHLQCDLDSVGAVDPTIIEIVTDQDLVLVFDKTTSSSCFAHQKQYKSSSRKVSWKTFIHVSTYILTTRLSQPLTQHAILCRRNSFVKIHDLIVG